ncbi:MAG: SprT-like domain-containing protein [Gammaproteobacteria bacterium]|nr:SprT-like domain-containing protein [Gammaproteobacteria bacterium]
MNLRAPTHLHRFRIDDPVAFVSATGEETGFIAAIKGHTALVVLDDEREFRVPVDMLKLRKDVQARRVRTRNDAARMEFAEHDFVSFLDSGQIRHIGTIVTLNPKYARVKCGDKTWQVPYVSLKHEGDTTSALTKRARLKAIEMEAEMLLQKHGLESWRFGFDHATRRGGRCAFKREEISLSEQFAFAASDEEVTDTILHEIAHALVGPNHGHDATWKATAKSIGCSGHVTHDIDFSSARWVLTCATCGWREPRLRRRRGLVCKSCGRAVEFQSNISKESAFDNL